MNPAPSITANGEVQTTCQRCQQLFSHSPVDRGHALRFLHPYCPACSPIIDAEREAQRREEARQAEMERRTRFWDKLCPPLYRESNRQRLPDALVQAADAWPFGVQGLGFIGESGIGKTRCMFLLLSRLIQAEGRRVRYVPMAEFSMKIAKLGFEAESYVEDLCKAEVLLLDDLGKGRLTDAVQGHLFHIVENRTANLRPLLFTSNAGVQQLAAMLSEDRAAPILRRLGEFCEVLTV